MCGFFGGVELVGAAAVEFLWGLEFCGDLGRAGGAGVAAHAEGGGDHGGAGAPDCGAGVGVVGGG